MSVKGPKPGPEDAADISLLVRSMLNLTNSGVRKSQLRSLPELWEAGLAPCGEEPHWVWTHGMVTANMDTMQSVRSRRSRKYIQSCWANFQPTYSGLFPILNIIFVGIFQKTN